MSNRHDVLRNSICSATLATIATNLTIAACARSEHTRVSAVFNAISHSVWGEHAALIERSSAHYTLTGTAVNSAAVLFWAGTHELLFGRRIERGGTGEALLSSAAIAGIAYVTDYYLVPKRFTPGFEKRLSAGSLAAIYTAMGLSLGLGRLYCSGRRSGHYAKNYSVL
jgi:hypothetical protein